MTMCQKLLPLDPVIAAYIGEQVNAVNHLNVKITAAAELAARFHGLPPDGDVKLSPDFKSLIVTTGEEVNAPDHNSNVQTPA